MKKTPEQKKLLNFIDAILLILILATIILFIASGILNGKIKDLPELTKIEATLKIQTMQSFGWATLIMGIILSILSFTLEMIIKKRGQQSPANYSVKQVKPKIETTPKKIIYQQPPKKVIVNTTQEKKWVCPNCGQENNHLAKNCINCFCEKPQQ